MKYALALAAATALVLIPLAARAVWRRFKQTQSTFDRLVDEAAPRKVCRECGENDALPPSAWCAVCSQQFADWLDEEAAALERGRNKMLAELLAEDAMLCVHGAFPCSICLTEIADRGETR